MKKLLALLLVLITILCLAACKPKDDPGLETEPVDTQPVDPNSLNLTDMQIVLPADATWVEQYAKTELNSHIEMMTGEYLDVVTEGEETGAAIYIGETDYAKSKNVTYTDNEFGEGWAIQAIDGNVVLRGGEVRGVLYAVYHLLEDVVGFHWWNLWDTYVPEGNPLVPKDYSDSGVPAMEYRAIHIISTSQKNANLIRNRLNGCMDGTSEANGGSEQYGYPAHVHTFSRYFPIRYAVASSNKRNEWFDTITNPDHEDFIDTHPDWYAWSNETNSRVSNGQVCLSSEGLYEALEEMLLKTIEFDIKYSGGIECRYYDFSPNDTEGHCECSLCVASIAEHGLSGHILRFINKLANAVREAGYDNIYMETLAYDSYVEPPLDDTVPADNVVIRFANNRMDILHDIDHPNNADFKRRLEAWSEIMPEGNMYIWDYGVTGATDGVFPTMCKYGVNYTKYYQESVNGMFLQLESPIDTDFWDMKFWLNTKLMEDPYLAMDEEGNYSQERFDALMDEFIYGFYGEAAGPYIREYLDYMYEKTVSADTHIGHSNYIIEAQWLTVEDILKGAEIFEKAYEAAGNDAELLKRLRMASSGFDRAVVENWRKWQKQAEELGIEFALDEQKIGYRLVTGLQEMIDQRDSMDASGEVLLVRYEKYLGITYPLPEELADIDPVHIHDYTAKTNTLNAHAIYKDPDSLVGEAITIYTATVSDNNRKLYYKINDSKGLRFNLQAKQGKKTKVGELFPDEIIADGQWHLYKFEDILIEYDLYNYMSMLFRDGSIQNKAITEDMARLCGKHVDFYISLKVTGDVTCEDPNNYPIYYLDRIIAVEQCEVDRKYYDGNATCTEDGTLTGPCNICGKTATVRDWGHPLGHTFTKYAMNADGYQTAYCDHGCGMVDNLTAGGNKMPDDLAALHDCFVYRTTFNNWANYGSTAYDSESLTTTVAKMDASKSANKTWFLNKDGKIQLSITTYYNGDNRWSIPIPADQLAANNDGKYHTYKIEDVVLVPKDATSITKIGIFGGSQLYTHDFAYVMYSNLKGKTVDVYLTMKYTGDITGADKTNPPTYWMEQLIVVDKEGRFSSVSENTATCTETGTKTGKCAICGGKTTMYAAAKGHVPGEWQTVTEPTCKIEGLKISKCTVCGADLSEAIPKTNDHVLGDWVVMPNHTRTKLCVVCEAYGATEMLDSNPVANELKNTHNCFIYEVNFGSDQGWEGDGEVGHDPYSVLGTAMKIDVQTTGNNKSFYRVTEDKGLRVGINHTPEGGKATNTYSEISLSALKEHQDGLYHFYKIDDYVLIPEGAGTVNYLSLFRANMLRNPSAIQDDFFQQLKGKKVDIYVSLRYTGDIETGKELVYYIDRVIVLNAEGAWKNMVNTATCDTAGTATGTCKVCGTQLTIASAALGHSFTNYVSNNNATCALDSTKTAKCDRCDATHTVFEEGTKKPHTFTVYTDNGNGTKTAKCDSCDTRDTVTTGGNRMPDEVAAMHECFYFRTTFGAEGSWVNYGEIVTDGYALGGEVAKMDTSKFSNKSWFLNTASKTALNITVYLKGTDNVVIPIPADQLAANKDKYHIYKIEDVVLVPNEATSATKMGIFGGSQLYSEAFAQTLFESVKGKTVDIYLNMKYTGDISGADTSDYPVYYVDQLIVADSEGTWEGQLTNSATCTDAGKLIGVCKHCGAEASVASPALGHSLTGIEAKAPTAQEPGNSAYWSCSVCGKYFSDAEGQNEIEKDSWLITGHVITKTEAKAPTAMEPGNSEYWSCSICGKCFSDAEGENEIEKGSWITIGDGNIAYKTTFKDIGWSISEANAVGEIVADNMASNGNSYKLTVPGTTKLNISADHFQLRVNFGGTNKKFNVAQEIVTGNSDGAYHFYKFKVNMPASPIDQLYLFRGQTFGSPALVDQLNSMNLQGQAVDIYVSMRYEGDITRASGGFAYWFDQIIIATGVSASE